MNQIMTKLLACLQPVWLMLISFLHWLVTMLPSVHSYISEYSIMITYRNESLIFNNATQFVIILVTDSLMNASVSKGQRRGFDPTEQVSEVCLESQSETSSWFMQLCLWLHFPPSQYSTTCTLLNLLHQPLKHPVTTVTIRCSFLKLIFVCLLVFHLDQICWLVIVFNIF